MPRLVSFALLALAACPGTSANSPHNGPDATIADVTAKLDTMRTSRSSFRADSTMDYWLGSQRVKGTVLVMGTTGAKIRFNALSPAGGDVLADMACNGAAFTYLDYQHNCQLTGPCNAQSIAALLHVELQPDDFVHLALGSPPVIANATGTVTWDANAGHENVALAGGGMTQKITIDGRDSHYDVIASELDGSDGKPIWSVENTDFRDVKDDNGSAARLPGKTRFKSPREQADLIVEWKEVHMNTKLDDGKFTIQTPAGLPECHGAQ